MMAGIGMALSACYQAQLVQLPDLGDARFAIVALRASRDGPWSLLALDLPTDAAIPLVSSSSVVRMQIFAYQHSRQELGIEPGVEIGTVPDTDPLARTLPAARAMLRRVDSGWEPTEARIDVHIAGPSCRPVRVKETTLPWIGNVNWAAATVRGGMLLSSSKSRTSTLGYPTRFVWVRRDAEAIDLTPTFLREGGPGGGVVIDGDHAWVAGWGGANGSAIIDIDFSADPPKRTEYPLQLGEDTRLNAFVRGGRTPQGMELYWCEILDSGRPEFRHWLQSDPGTLNRIGAADVWRPSEPPCLTRAFQTQAWWTGPGELSFVFQTPRIYRIHGASVTADARLLPQETCRVRFSAPVSPRWALAQDDAVGGDQVSLHRNDGAGFDRGIVDTTWGARAFQEVGDEIWISGSGGTVERRRQVPSDQGTELLRCPPIPLSLQEVDVLEPWGETYLVSGAGLTTEAIYYAELIPE